MVEGLDEVEELHVPCGGKVWRIHKGNMEQLWAAMGSLDEGLPYWAEIWPSSLALGDFLAQQPLHGLACLDLGCGLGLTALVGAAAGGRVQAVDLEARAIALACENKALNAALLPYEQAERQEQKAPATPTWPQFFCMDWENPSISPNSVERLWAGDIMYEKVFAAPIARFFSYALKENGKVWIAEPGRKVFLALLDILPSFSLCASKILEKPIMPLISQKLPVPVSIWEIVHKK